MQNAKAGVPTWSVASRPSLAELNAVAVALTAEGSIFHVESTLDDVLNA